MNRADTAEINAPTQGLIRSSLWKALRSTNPFTLLAGAIMLTVTWLPSQGCVPCTFMQRVLVTGVVVAFLLLERLDSFVFGDDAPPLRTALLLFAMRFLLSEVVVRVSGLTFGIWAYALLPSVGGRYFGARGALVSGVLVLLVTLPRILTDLSVRVYDPSALPEAVGAAGFYSAILVFITVSTAILMAEKAGRQRAERLLAHLARSGRQRDEYAQHTLTLTEELNVLARSIHHDLSRRLEMIHSLLAGASPLAGKKGEHAWQAASQAKQEAAAALHDVRRSVGALRKIPSIPLVEPVTGDYAVENEVRRGWRAFLFQRPFDLACVSLYLAQLAAELSWLAYERRLWSLPALAMAGVVLFLVLLERLDLWLFRGAPTLVQGSLLLGLRLLAIALVAWTNGLYWAIWFLLVLPYQISVYFGSRAGLFFALLLAGGVTFTWGALSGQSGITPEVLATLVALWLIILSVVVASNIAVKEWTGRLRASRLLVELRSELDRLAHSSNQALAAVRERNHLAREIHDGLGHYLTVINVQLEKALAYSEINPQVAAGAMREARRMTGAALQEMRSGLGASHSDGGGLSLATLINRLARNLTSAQMTVRVRVEGSEEGFIRDSLAALYRVAQEGLTNAHKHAQARHIDLHLTFGEEAASLRLTDNGRGFEHVVMSDNGQEGGYGLQGLRERLDLAGGKLEVSSVPGAGVTLMATIPRKPLVR